MSVEERYSIEIIRFGKRLRQIREEKNLSQLDIELQSGINRTEISRIENGQKNIEFYTIIKLSEALGIKLSTLFTD
ncbi:MAG: XRE family transcriptional regulator [Sphingobacteriales bacterium]|nr:MAG: XRE family transcriptional regulator [Sphingobacteriales bacterium]